MILGLLIVGGLVGYSGICCILSCFSLKISKEELWFELTDDSKGWYKGLIAVCITNMVALGLLHLMWSVGIWPFAVCYIVGIGSAAVILWRGSVFLINSSEESCDDISTISSGRAFERWNLSETNFNYLRLKMATKSTSPTELKNGTFQWTYDLCRTNRATMIAGISLAAPVYLLCVLSPLLLYLYDDEIDLC